MGRKIICPKCNTVFDEEILQQKHSEDICLVCGECLSGEFSDGISVPIKDKTNYYYYNGAGGTLTTTLYEDEKPLYTFEAVDMEDAERQLKKVLPNSPLFHDNSFSGISCPRCFSKEIQLVPKRFSILTGFATNRYDRMCIRCRKKF